MQGKSIWGFGYRTILDACTCPSLSSPQGGDRMRPSVGAVFLLLTCAASGVYAVYRALCGCLLGALAWTWGTGLQQTRLCGAAKLGKP